MANACALKLVFFVRVLCVLGLKKNYERVWNNVILT